MRICVRACVWLCLRVFLCVRVSLCALDCACDRNPCMFICGVRVFVCLSGECVCVCVCVCATVSVTVAATRNSQIMMCQNP
jgi:hypothetical protein